jgi:hypothetical protein
LKRYRRCADRSTRRPSSLFITVSTGCHGHNSRATRGELPGARNAGFLLGWRDLRSQSVRARVPLLSPPERRGSAARGARDAGPVCIHVISHESAVAANCHQVCQRGGSASLHNGLVDKELAFLAPQSRVPGNPASTSQPGLCAVKAVKSGDRGQYDQRFP